MASFTYTAGDTWLTITVRGLSSGQRVRYYVRLATGATAVIDEIYTSTGTSLTKTFDGLQQNTQYAANAGVVTGSGTDWIGTQYFTTKTSSGGGGGDVDPTPSRPSNWQWQSAIYSGATMNISAIEWNAFTSRIDDFRNYAGLSNYGFSTVSRGQSISYWIVNQAVNGISTIPGRGWMLPATVNTGEILTASFFTNLRDALNAIP